MGQVCLSTPQVYNSQNASSSSSSSSVAAAAVKKTKDNIKQQTQRRKQKTNTTTTTTITPTPTFSTTTTTTAALAVEEGRGSTTLPQRSAAECKNPLSRRDSLPSKAHKAKACNGGKEKAFTEITSTTTTGDDVSDLPSSLSSPSVRTNSNSSSSSNHSSNTAAVVVVSPVQRITAALEDELCLADLPVIDIKEAMDQCGSAEFLSDVLRHFRAQFRQQQGKLLEFARAETWREFT